jgi:5-(carboxyamino)imidazole ribonucleotide mutase
VKEMSNPIIGVVMGSDSDWPTMKQATDILDQFSVSYEKKVVSAHRTPNDMADYGETARERGLQIIIAGAGGAAHLPGMLASHTTLPVIGVPIQTSALGGVDSLYSIVQMPNGIPVATVAIGKAQNAGLLALRMLGMTDSNIAEKLSSYHAKLADESRDKTNNLI